jgi:hypothetical protein
LVIADSFLQWAKMAGGVWYSMMKIVAKMAGNGFGETSSSVGKWREANLATKKWRRSTHQSDRPAALHPPSTLTTTTPDTGTGHRTP